MALTCVYQDCLSVKYPCSRITFFQLPNDHRRSIWIRNSGNKSLQKISEKAQRYFCEKHFRDCDINSQFNRKLLRRDAVPKPHHSLNTNLYTVEYTKSPDDSKNTQKYTEHNEDFIDNPDYSNLFEEYQALDTSTIVDNSLDENRSDPYSLIEFYKDDNEEPSTTRILLKNNEEIQNANKSSDEQGESLEIFIEENSNNNEVDSSTLELEEPNNLKNQDASEESTTECTIPVKKKRSNEKEPPLVETPNTEIVHLPTVSSYNSYEEDKHFALSLVGYFQRLPQTKKSMAKLKILQYLTELEVDLPTSL